MSKRHHELVEQQDKDRQPEGLQEQPRPAYDKHRPPIDLKPKHPEAHPRETMIVKYDDEVTFQNGAATVKDAEHPLDDQVRHDQLRDRNYARSRRHELRD